MYISLVLKRRQRKVIFSQTYFMVKDAEQTQGMLAVWREMPELKLSSVVLCTLNRISNKFLKSVIWSVQSTSSEMAGYAQLVALNNKKNMVHWPHPVNLLQLLRHNLPPFSSLPKKKKTTRTSTNDQIWSLGQTKTGIDMSWKPSKSKDWFPIDSNEN